MAERPAQAIQPPHDKDIILLQFCENFGQARANDRRAGYAVILNDDLAPRRLLCLLLE